MIELVKSNERGQDVTTSLIVAEVFGKEHNKVVRDIENLSMPEDWNAANFGVIYEKDSMNRKRKVYEMTKDGFTFLVMGYTGEKASTFKIQFIEEFNKRTALLNDPMYILQRGREILEENVRKLEADLSTKTEMLEIKDVVIKEIAPKAEYHDKVLSAEGSIPATHIAKELGMSGSRLNKILKEQGVQYRVDGTWVLKAKYQNQGYTRNHTYTFNDGEKERTSISMRWTQKGRKFIHDVISNAEQQVG